MCGQCVRSSKSHAEPQMQLICYVAEITCMCTYRHLRTSIIEAYLYTSQLWNSQTQSIIHSATHRQHWLHHTSTERPHVLRLVHTRCTICVNAIAGRFSKQTPAKTTFYSSLSSRTCLNCVNWCLTHLRMLGVFINIEWNLSRHWYRNVVRCNSWRTTHLQQNSEKNVQSYNVCRARKYCSRSLANTPHFNKQTNTQYSIRFEHTSHTHWSFWADDASRLTREFHT